MSSINIVMFHYVRPIKGSEYPNIKGLELDGFKRQLDYLAQKFLFITAEDVVDAVTKGKELPDNSCWLTFDDGYKDHFLYVLPELSKRKIQGGFFPPVKPVTERVMLDVNSIQYILASASNVIELIGFLNTECLKHGVTETELKNLWLQYAIESKYDTKEVIYVKRLLQHALEEPVRNEVTSLLFRRYLGVSQTDFAENVYMSEREVKELINAGMYVGSHGYRHLWLNKEDRESQKLEIDRSLSFLSAVGARTVDWIMCYPYGAYNQDTLDILDEAKCAVGITTEVAKADLKLHHRLKMPRFDTNDFPQ
jgi:peptidoglycan/xylan/chitin deacetylase (PgdA/CDA1 family)